MSTTYPKESAVSAAYEVAYCDTDEVEVVTVTNCRVEACEAAARASEDSGRPVVVTNVRDDSTVEVYDASRRSVWEV